jgi:putative sterol carrier protein
MTAKEMILQMPASFRPEKAGDTSAVIQYAISEPAYTVIKEGQMTAHEGTAENPTVTIEMADENLVKMFKGELNPMTAFMMGKLKIKGDMLLAQRLSSFMGRD